jgi:uncharacterized iron-regulated membrane protein
MQFIKDLHTELLLGQPGMLFLGLMGLCFVASIVSGAVIYGPFMRRLDFGTLRSHGSRRLYWLDWHNLAGIVLMAWLFVVGMTGAINTLSQQIAQRWMRTELAEMIGPWRTAAPPSRIVPAQKAVDAALSAAPGMSVATVAMPGSAFAGKHHYDVFLTGAEPLTSKLTVPVLVNAEYGSVTEMRSLPMYAQILFLSRPLHFGDYGGMPLKVIWGLLDITAIGILVSGLYLWLVRRWHGRGANSRIAASGR